MLDNGIRIFIILLNYNGYNDTICCLESLKKISYPGINIVIIDNDSSDNSVDKICNYLDAKCTDYITFNNQHAATPCEKTIPYITIIQSGRNGGYGHGNNIGIKYALAQNADYLLILNNDTVVDPGFLEPLVEMAENDKKIGIISSKIYFYDRPDRLWFNGGRFNPYTAKVEHYNFNEKDIGQEPLKENTFISGCLWLIPQKIFKEVGLINEEYFMYVEDLEYCHRVLKHGYTLKVCDKSHVLHKVGSSSGNWSPFFAYWMAKNKIKFIKEHLTGICKLTALSYHIFYSSLWWLSHRRLDLFRAHVKGILEK